MLNVDLYSALHIINKKAALLQGNRAILLCFLVPSLKFTDDIHYNLKCSL